MQSRWFGDHQASGREWWRLSMAMAVTIIIKLLLCLQLANLDVWTLFRSVSIGQRCQWFGESSGRTNHCIKHTSWTSLRFYLCMEIFILGTGVRAHRFTRRGCFWVGRISTQKDTMAKLRWNQHVWIDLVENGHCVRHLTWVICFFSSCWFRLVHYQQSQYQVRKRRDGITLGRLQPLQEGELILGNELYEWR